MPFPLESASITMESQFTLEIPMHIFSQTKLYLVFRKAKLGTEMFFIQGKDTQSALRRKPHHEPKNIKTTIFFKFHVKSLLFFFQYLNQLIYQLGSACMYHVSIMGS